MDDLYRRLGRACPSVDEQLDAAAPPAAPGTAGRLPPLRLDPRCVRRDGDRRRSRPLLVLEGVGSGSRAVADLVTVLVWVEAPRAYRMGARPRARRRGLRALLGRRGPSPSRSTSPARHPRARRTWSSRPRRDLGGLLLGERRAARGPPAARSPSEPWMPIAATVVPSARSRVTQGAPGGRCTATICGPLVLAAAVAVDDDQPLGLGDDPRAHQGEPEREGEQTEERRRCRAGTGVNVARVSSSKPNQARAQTTSRPPPKTAPAIRTPNGRQVCGSGRHRRLRAGRHGCR